MADKCTRCNDPMENRKKLYCPKCEKAVKQEIRDKQYLVTAPKHSETNVRERRDRSQSASTVLPTNEDDYGEQGEP